MEETRSIRRKPQALTCSKRTIYNPSLIFSSKPQPAVCLRFGSNSRLAFAYILVRAHDRALALAQAFALAVAHARALAHVRAIALQKSLESTNGCRGRRQRPLYVAASIDSRCLQRAPRLMSVHGIVVLLAKHSLQQESAAL